MERKGKPYHHGNLRQTLIDEGLKALRTQAPEELSLREIARAIGVSPNAPYRHFKTKEDLLAGLSEVGYEELSRALIAVKEDGPMKRFRAIGEAFERFAAENRPLFRLMFGTHSPTPGENREHCFGILAESVRVLLGEVTVNDETIHATQAAWSLFFGFSILKSEGALPGSSSSPADLRELARILGKGLRD